MEKILTGQNNCDIFDEILSTNESIINGVIDFNNKKSMSKTLLSCVKYMDNASCDNNTLGISFGFNHIGFNEELSNAKVRYLAAKLACAIDSDSVEEIRRIKKEYGNTAEFSKAKDFLNKKCKEIWNVFDSKDKSLKLPYKAMKTLGITNQPTLEFLFENSLKYYEKDNGTTTVDIINSILDNKNIDYTFTEIVDYLKKQHKNNRIKYNFKTTEYLIRKMDFDEEKIIDLGIEKSVLSHVFKNLSVVEKLKYLFKNRRRVFKLNIS